MRRILAGFMAVCFILSQTAPTVQAVSELDTTFFHGNDITFYDPTCETAKVSRVTLAGDNNIEKLMNLFMREGNMNVAQASGILGNMIQESGGRTIMIGSGSKQVSIQEPQPNIRQGGRIVDDTYVPENSVGFGLVQWTFTGRQKPLQDHMRKLGVGITDLSGQGSFVLEELRGPYKKTLDALLATNDPVEAAVIVHGPPYPGYEASADSAEKVRTVRGGNAKKIYDAFFDASALAGSTAPDALNNPSTGDGDTSSTDAAQQVSNSTTSPQNSKDSSCNESGFNGGDLSVTTTAYAWSDYKGNDIKARQEYTDAVNRAMGEKRYVGGTLYKGIDCGGFVTTLLYDSGFDKSYNSNAKGGNTVSQEAWLKENWTPISATDAGDRQPGDVAINAQHTYVYVGDINGFNSKIASASWDERAPMAGKEAVTDSSFRWYRIKATEQKNINV